MSVLPWEAANAKLLDLRAPGGSDDYGDVSDENAVAVWTGELEAQIQRQRKTVISGGQNTPVDFDVLIVRQPPQELVDAQSGDEGTGWTLLVRDERKAPVERRFRIVTHEYRGKGESESVRCELEGERIP